MAEVGFADLIDEALITLCSAYKSKTLKTLIKKVQCSGVRAMLKDYMMR